MQINIYSIAKKDIKYQAVQEELCMQCRQFGAYIESFELMPQMCLKPKRFDHYSQELLTHRLFCHILSQMPLISPCTHKGKAADFTGLPRLSRFPKISFNFLSVGRMALKKNF